MTEPATTDIPGAGRTSEPTRAPTITSRMGTYLDRAPRRSWERYGIAVGLTVVAWSFTLALLPHIERLVFVFFWPAVLISAVLGGLGPALVASLLATALVDWFVLQRAGADRAPTVTDLAPLIVFFVASMIMSSVANALRVTRRRAADASAELHDVALQLEEQAVELEQQLEESQALQEELEQTSAELSERTHQAEAADAFSRGILASIADPFVVQDRDWRFIYINSAAAELFARAGHRSPESLIGRAVWDIFPETVGTETERGMRHAKEQGIPYSFEVYSPDAATWSVMNCYPLPNGGLATQWKDITAQRRGVETAHYLARVSEVLGSSLEYETTLRELAHVVVPELAEWCTITIVEDDGSPRQLVLAHADPAKIAWAEELNRRYPPAADSPVGVPNVLRTGKPELYPEITDEMIDVGAIDDEHRRITRELGLRSAMLVPLVVRERVLGVLSLLSIKSGRRYGPDDLALATEIARRAAFAMENALLHRAERLARQAADEANTAKMQFLAVMSHELRTPLNAIGGYAQLLRLGLRGPITEEQAQDIDRVTLNQRNLLGLINDILNFAKVEAGHVEFNLADVPVTPLLADLETVVSPQLQTGRLTLTQRVDGDGLAVRADGEKVRQIMLNLLSNAIKFTPAGGTIDIECAAAGEQVRIDVRDSGIGIATDRLGAVFDPFVQLDRTLTSRHEGTGLGLSISRDLARAMGGEITAVSTLSGGSTFSLTLPRAGQ